MNIQRDGFGPWICKLGRCKHRTVKANDLNIIEAPSLKCRANRHYRI